MNLTLIDLALRAGVGIRALVLGMTTHLAVAVVFLSIHAQSCGRRRKIYLTMGSLQSGASLLGLALTLILPLTLTRALAMWNTTVKDGIACDLL